MHLLVATALSPAQSVQGFSVSPGLAAALYGKIAMLEADHS